MSIKSALKWTYKLHLVSLPQKLFVEYVDFIKQWKGSCVLSFLFVHYYRACGKIRKFNRRGIKVVFQKMLKMIRFWLEFGIHLIHRRNFNSISFYICMCECVCAHVREKKRQGGWEKLLLKTCFPWGGLQDGGGVRRGDHLPPDKYIKNTSTCGTTPTERLLNPGRRPQTSQKARNSPCTWVGQKKKKQNQRQKNRDRTCNFGRELWRRKSFHTLGSPFTGRDGWWGRGASEPQRRAQQQGCGGQSREIPTQMIGANQHSPIWDACLLTSWRGWGLGVEPWDSEIRPQGEDWIGWVKTAWRGLVHHN